jgi:AraC family transcriptional regulator of adaptative response/methylated-DNA-[protein]-cysteine methyltransferase
VKPRQSGLERKIPIAGTYSRHYDNDMNNMTHPPTSDMNTNADARWLAVLSRDPAADNAFLYAVTTTGVYCRPSCPSRRPRRDHVRFFDDAASAQRAGFRPCRRCRPHESDTETRVVARVRSLLEAPGPPPSLRQLGEAVGLSPYHLQRVFKRATGASPKQYAMAVRADRLKDELRRGRSVTTAILEAGYGSTATAYADAAERLGMSPGAYRRGGEGQCVAYDVVDSPLGRMLVAATDRGVCALLFGADEELLAELRRDLPQAELRYDPDAVAPFVGKAVAHLEGRSSALDLPLDASGTTFQRRVWAALASIPPGETRSYHDIAVMIGAPGAARAVAQACAANPVAVAVPCHRVVRSDGKPGGYRWGTERKQRLLLQERSVRPE